MDIAEDGVILSVGAIVCFTLRYPKLLCEVPKCENENPGREA
jgi:hypothetical protein